MIERAMSMKTCGNCGATAFDDMDICFSCLTPLPGKEKVIASPEELEFLGEVEVEEPDDQSMLRAVPSMPSVLTASRSPIKAAASRAPFRLRVQFPGQFLYDAYLAREEGASLRIGCAADNNIIIPHNEVGRHQLTLRYMQGQLWLEDHGPNHPALVDDIPLSGMRGISVGSSVALGDALLTLLSAEDVPGDDSGDVSAAQCRS